MSERIDSSFARRARERMEQLGLGVSELARRAGYGTSTQTSFHLMEGKKARRVPWERLEAYAKVLGCTPEWLARGEGPPPRPPQTSPAVVRHFGLETDVPPRLETLGERVKYARARINVTQAEFATRLSRSDSPVSRQAINKIEHDQVEDPSCRIMVAIEETTGFRVRWLFNGRGLPREDSAPKRAPLDVDALASALATLGVTERVPGMPAVTEGTRAAMLAALYERAAQEK